MIYRIRLGRWRFTFTMAHTQMVTGVNSLLPDGNHLLMWDFDELTLAEVMRVLEDTQAVYKLPNIYIFETKEGLNFFAYCFKRTDWRKTVEIITWTPLVDWGFIKFGVFRGHFTLRVTPKCYRIPKLVWILKSDVPEDCSLLDLRSWVHYETLTDGQYVKYKEVIAR